MPRVRCRWYDDDGSPIKGGCRRLHTGGCDFVHPSDPIWDSVAKPRVAFADPPPRDLSSHRKGFGRGSFDEPQVKDTGWSQRKPSFGERRDRSGGWGENQRDEVSWPKPDAAGPSADVGVSWGTDSTGGEKNASASTWGANNNTWGAASPVATSWGNPSTSTWGKSPPRGSTDDNGGWGSGWTSGAASSAADAWGGETSNWDRNATASGVGWDSKATPASPGGGWGRTERPASPGDGWGVPKRPNSPGGSWNTVERPASPNASWGQTTAPASTGNGGDNYTTPGGPSGGKDRTITHSGQRQVANRRASHGSEAVWNGRPTGTTSTGWREEPSSSNSKSKLDRDPFEVGSSSKHGVAESGTQRTQGTNGDIDTHSTGGWSGIDRFADSHSREKSSATLAGSASSTHDPTSMDVDAAATYIAERPESPPLPDGPPKVVKTFLNAIYAYREWEAARDTYLRQKALFKGNRHAHVSEAARDTLKDNMKRVEAQCESAQKRRDNALRELKPHSGFFGFESSSSPATSSSATEDDGAFFSTMKGIKTEIETWIETVRPIVESLRTQHNVLDSRPVSVTTTPSAIPTAGPSSDILSRVVHDDVPSMQHRLERIETRVDDLEDFQEKLCVDVRDSMSRVDEHIPTATSEHQMTREEQKAFMKAMSTHDVLLTEMNQKLTVLHGKMDAISSNPRLATALEVQKLRADQELLKLQAMQLEQINEILTQQYQETKNSITEMKATINNIVTSGARTTPLSLQANGGLDIEELVSIVEPLLRSQAREDVHLAVTQMKTGFEAAFTRQHEQICGAVWKRLWPALKIIGSIRQHCPIVVDSVLDNTLLQSESADVPEADGPVSQS